MLNRGLLGSGPRQTALRAAAAALLLVAALAVSLSLPAEAQEDERAVSGVSLSSTIPGELIITWTAPSLTPDDYRVIWAKSSESFRSFRDTEGNGYPTSTSYSVTGLEEDTEYKVRVRARYFDTNGNLAKSGPWSAVQTVTITATAPATTPAPTPPRPPAPTNLRAIPASNRVTLFWDYDQTAQGYQIWRGATADALEVLAANTRTGYRALVDEDVSAQTTYVYAVVAITAQGYSQQSDTASATTSSASAVRTLTLGAVSDSREAQRFKVTSETHFLFRGIELDVHEAFPATTTVTVSLREAHPTGYDDDELCVYTTPNEILATLTGLDATTTGKQTLTAPTPVRLTPGYGYFIQVNAIPQTGDGTGAGKLKLTSPNAGDGWQVDHLIQGWWPGFQSWRPASGAVSMTVLGEQDHWTLDNLSYGTGDRAHHAYGTAAVAQGFRTGSKAGGYLLQHIALKVQEAEAGSFNTTATLRAANQGAYDKDAIVTLNGSFRTTGKQKFTPENPVRLVPDTTYYIHLDTPVPAGADLWVFPGDEHSGDLTLHTTIADDRGFKSGTWGFSSVRLGSSAIYGSYTGEVSNCGNRRKIASAADGEGKLHYCGEALVMTVSARPARTASPETSGSNLPAQPSGINGTAHAGHAVITWDDPSDAAVTGYQVLRGPDAANLEILVENIGAALTGFIDTGLEAGSTNVYAVKAISAEGASPASESVSLTLPATGNPPRPDHPVSLVSNATALKMARTRAVRTNISVAQGFTTGPHTAGYTLTGVTVARSLVAFNKRSELDAVSASLHSASGTTPGERLFGLKGNFRNSTVTLTPEGSADATLQPDTTYFLTVAAPDFPANSRLELGMSNQYEDADSLPGWSIRDQHLFRAGEWKADDRGSMLINLKGQPISSGNTPQPQTPENAAPQGAPTGLDAEITHHVVRLTWNNPDDDTVTGYQILRGPDASELEVLTSDTGNADTSYTDDTGEYRTTYVYAVQTIRGTEVSANSPTLALTTKGRPAGSASPGVVLVSNGSQCNMRRSHPLRSNRPLAQGFTTGTNAQGYVLTRALTAMSLSSPQELSDLDLIKAHLHAANTDGTAPGEQLFEFRLGFNPDAHFGSGNISLTPVNGADTALASETTYHLVVSAPGLNSKARFELTLCSTAEDAGSQPAWSIADRYQRGNTDTTSWQEIRQRGPLKLRVAGRTN